MRGTLSACENLEEIFVYLQAHFGREIALQAESELSLFTGLEEQKRQAVSFESACEFFSRNEALKSLQQAATEHVCSLA